MMQGGEKAKNFSGSFKKLIRYIGNYKFAILAVMIFAAISTVFSVAGPKVMGKATTALAEGLMKKIAGTLKIDQAQYRELESFSKFGGDLDPVTQMVIDKGQKNARLLVQPQYAPMPVEEEIAIIYCGTQGLLQRVPLKHVGDFEKYFLDILRVRYRKEVLDELKVGRLDEVVAALLEEVAKEVADKFAAPVKQTEQTEEFVDK